MLGISLLRIMDLKDYNFYLGGIFMECLCVDCGVNKGDLISPVFIDPPVYQCGDCAEIAYEQSIKE